MKPVPFAFFSVICLTHPLSGQEAQEPDAPRSVPTPGADKQPAKGPADRHNIREWTSPDGKTTVQLGFEKLATGNVYHLFQGGQKLEAPESPIRRENHGFDWLQEAPGVWVDNRYLVFEDDHGLCLVDGQNGTVLLNQTFAGHVKSPSGAAWAAIRYRATAHDQEQLHPDTKDTLWIIRPDSLSAQRAKSSAENPFAHVHSVPLEGVALARPSWTTDGKGVVVALYDRGQMKAILVDGETQQIRENIPLFGLHGQSLKEEQILSPWFSPEAESLVHKALAGSGLLQPEVPTDWEALITAVNTAKLNSTELLKAAEAQALQNHLARTYGRGDIRLIADLMRKHPPGEPGGQVMVLHMAVLAHYSLLKIDDLATLFEASLHWPYDQSDDIPRGQLSSDMFRARLGRHLTGLLDNTGTSKDPAFQRISTEPVEWMKAHLEAARGRWGKEEDAALDRAIKILNQAPPLAKPKR